MNIPRSEYQPSETFELIGKFSEVKVILWVFLGKVDFQIGHAIERVDHIDKKLMRWDFELQDDRSDPIEAAKIQIAFMVAFQVDHQQT